MSVWKIADERLSKYTYRSGVAAKSMLMNIYLSIPVIPEFLQKIVLISPIICLSYGMVLFQNKIYQLPIYQVPYSFLGQVIQATAPSLRDSFRVEHR
jgi:hypothetical protein